MANNLETALNNADTITEAIDALKTTEATLAGNKVSNFAYTDTAYNEDTADGVEEYNYNNEQNIPKKNLNIINVNETVILKGYRSQASSVTRMFMNHFLGRVSYNLNKTVDVFNGLLTSIKSYLGAPNGIATLDETGRVPLSQLPESTIVYKGQWNASTNTPHLIDGTGTQGDFYEVNVAGWFDSVTGTASATEVAGYEQYFVGDGIIYDGDSWNRRGSGDVKTVNGVAPVKGDVKNVIPVTTAQFEALTEEEKKGKFFIVTDDSTDLLTIINDITPSLQSTYSSVKIDELIGQGGTGTVKTVNDVEPDAEGNVDLLPSNIGALPVEGTTDLTADFSISTSESIDIGTTNDSTSDVWLINRGTGDINLTSNSGAVEIGSTSGKVDIISSNGTTCFVNKNFHNYSTEYAELCACCDVCIYSTDGEAILYADNSVACVEGYCGVYLCGHQNNIYLITSNNCNVMIQQGGATSYSKAVTTSMFSFDSTTGTLSINM